MTRISRSMVRHDTNVSGRLYSVQGLGNLLQYRNLGVIPLDFILGVNLFSYRCFHSAKIGWKARAIAGDADAVYIPIALITTISEVYFPYPRCIFVSLFTPTNMVTLPSMPP